MARDIIDMFNYVFGNMDRMFRDIERDFSTSNLLPTITVPAVKSYYTEQRSITKDDITTYYKDGMVSRLDGPAVVKEDGTEEYWIDGKQITEDKFKEIRQEIEDKKEHTIYIDGKPKKVTGSKLKELTKLLE